MTRDEALQAVVAGEHAAVYAFGVIGGRLAGTDSEAAAKAAWERHRERRDTATALLVAGGSEVPAAAPAYDLGGPVITPAGARRAAARVELACCGPYADWVGASAVAAASGSATSSPSHSGPASSTEAERATAADWLADSAAAVVGWGGAPATFPGLPERG